MNGKAKPKYSTWIRMKNIYIFWIITVSIVVVSVLIGNINQYFLLLAILALPFLYISIVITFSAYRFSEKGNGYQDKIHAMIIDAVSRKGKVLDIGCGNGNLIIKITRKNNENNFGIDFWGKDWEYSKTQCEKNAELENVKTIHFQKASASKLPFENGSIENVVSCLTFHEVQDVGDKTECIKEALRVLKDNGTFTFFDLFNDKKYYPDYTKIRMAIQQAGGAMIEESTLLEKMRLPFPLNNKNVLKYAVLITGVKNRTTASL